MANLDQIKNNILNEAFRSSKEIIADYYRRKSVLESFGYEFDMDNLPILSDKWAVDAKKHLISLVDSIATPKDKLSVFDVVEVYKNPEHNEDYIVVRIFGGLNGMGDWVDYLNTIQTLIETIKKDYRCWLVQLVNDCPDDVFTLDIGIENPEITEKEQL